MEDGLKKIKPSTLIFVKKKDLSIEFCECALEKATVNYSNFAAAMKDEVGLGKTFLDCIDKDIDEEEEPANN